MHFDNSNPEHLYYPTDDTPAPRIMEKDYYSNFVCCGIQLNDLHELVSHFEENHAQATLSSFPESLPEPVSPSSPMIESPVSACPLTPSPPNLFPTLTAPFTPSATAFPQAVQPDTTTSSPYLSYATDVMSIDRSRSEFILPDEKKEDRTRSLWSSSTSGANAINSSTAGNDPCATAITHSSYLQLPLNAEPTIRQERITSEMTSQATCQQVPASPQNNTSRYHPFPPTLAPTPIYARHPNLAIITDLTQDLLSSPEEGGRSASDVSAPPDSKEINQSQGGRRKKVLHNNNLKPAREKTYKCPHAGCIKSYLNLNGLKYHLTKGVCTTTS